MANVGDAIKENSMRHWSLIGSHRLVKVVSVSSRNYMGNSKNRNKNHVSGYVTEERYLWGQTSEGIEQTLGLRPFELRPLAYVYALKRLPTIEEVKFRLTAAFPKGQPIAKSAAEAGKAFYHSMENARSDYAKEQNLYYRSMTPVVQLYGPGSNMIPQWELTNPVPLGALIATVTPILAFPRPNGSVKPYTPHNRGRVR